MHFQKDTVAAFPIGLCLILELSLLLMLLKQIALAAPSNPKHPAVAVMEKIAKGLETQNER